MTLETILELIQSAPYSQSSLRWIQENPPKDFNRETLVVYSHKVHLGAVRGKVPTDLLLKKFGADFLLWLWLHAEYEEEQNRIIQAYAEATQKDLVLLQTIRKALHELGVHQDPIHLKKTYATINNIESAVVHIETQTLLQQYANKTLQSLEEFTVIPLSTERSCIYKSYCFL